MRTLTRLERLLCSLGSAAVMASFAVLAAMDVAGARDTGLVELAALFGLGMLLDLEAWKAGKELDEEEDADEAADC